MQQEDIKYLLKLNSVIFRSSQVYLDKALKEYELSSGSYPYLFILKNNEGISQSKISEELGCDKAMTARTITKLIELGYIDKQKDESNYKSNKIYLTEKARIVIVQVIDKIDELIQLMTMGLSEQEKLNTMDSMNKILNNIRKL
ncbi:MAG: MarR family transcriptional regulator [Mobilitalea sp.]